MELSLSLKGKTVLVPGGGGGIGIPTLWALAQAGACVLAMEPAGTPGAAAAEEAVKAMRKQDLQADFIDCNILSDESCKAALETVAARNYHVTSMAFVAGYVSTENVLAENATQALLNQVDLHVCSLIRLLQPLIPQWLQSGSGTVIAMTSIAGDLPAIGKPIYSASKAAATNLMLALAAEYGSRGLRFVPVLANRIGTPSARARAARAPEFEAEMVSTQLSRQWIQPEEVAATFRYLLSDAARPINGDKFYITDGALSALAARPVLPA